jgi:hypothetical protein
MRFMEMKHLQELTLAVNTTSSQSAFADKAVPAG